MGTKRAFGHHNVTRRPETDRRVTVWLAMRQLIRFDIPTLVMTTETVHATTRDYTYRLQRAGYLRMQRVPVAGLHGSKFVYHLVRDTGPKAPITRKNGDVYDQNQNKTYSPKPAKGAADDEASA